MSFCKFVASVFYIYFFLNILLSSFQNMSEERKRLMFYGLSVIERSLLYFVSASDDFSLCAAFLLLFIYLFIVSLRDECNSRFTSFSINHPTAWSCLCQLSRDPLHFKFHQNQSNGLGTESSCMRIFIFICCELWCNNTAEGYILFITR
jgi:hypothetical protein